MMAGGEAEATNEGEIPAKAKAGAAMREAHQLLAEAVRVGDEGLMGAALSDALVLLHNEVVRAHIGIVRRRCGADAALAVEICNALSETSAFRLQRWALLSAARWDDVNAGQV
jgi:hypothetical protein